MRIAYENAFDQYTITPSSENASYPVTNVQDQRLSKLWRSLAVSDVTLDIDTASAHTYNCIIISAHNLTSGATIKIQADDSADYGSLILNETVTWNAGHIVHFITGASNCRYWRLYIDDDTNTDLYVQAGRVFLCNYLQLTPSSLVPFEDNRNTTSKKVYSNSRQVYGNEGVSYITRRYSFPHINETMYDSLNTFQNYSDVVYPFYLINTDDQNSAIDPLYCTLAERINFRALGHDTFTYEMSVEECK